MIPAPQPSRRPRGGALDDAALDDAALADDFAMRAQAAARRRSRHRTPSQSRRGLALLAGLEQDGRLPVRATRGIGTARMRLAATGPVVELDPAFVHARIRTDDDALHLLSHELLHRVRGDLCRFLHVDRATWSLFNLALDVFVDAHLEALWFDGAGAPYQRLLYAPDRFPDLLLLPPLPLLEDIGGADARAFLEEGAGPFRSRSVAARARPSLVRAVARRLRHLDVAWPDAVAELYADGWLRQVDLSRFWSRFREVMRPELPAVLRAGMPLLLGEHPAPGGRDPALPELQALLEDALGVRFAGGHGHALQAQDLAPDEEAADPGPLLATLLRAVESDPRHPTVRQRLVPTRGVVPRAGRREVLSLAAGITPVFWRSPVTMPVEDHDRVHLYVDASGSMDASLPFLFRLVSTLQDHVGDRVLLFSNQVVPATLQALSEGRYETTGGTDFDCVLRDALDRGWRRIVVVTDGYADADAALIARARIEGLQCWTVLLGAHVRSDHPLAALPGDSWQWVPPEHC